MRLALKTGSYSLMHLTIAIAVTYAITQDWARRPGRGADRAGGPDGGVRAAR